MAYKLCPRCELNYIPCEEEYCAVCKAELKIGPQLKFANTDDDDIQEKLCPICKQNYISSGEEMCESCREASQYEESENVDIDKDEGWKQFLDDDEKEEIIDKNDGDEINFSDLDKEEAKKFFEDDDYEEEEEEEEVESVDEDDDFDHGPIDQKDFEEYDDEDDKKDDDEDDDDFDDDFEDTPKKRK